jgi:hypothetical protein
MGSPDGRVVGAAYGFPLSVAPGSLEAGTVTVALPVPAGTGDALGGAEGAGTTYTTGPSVGVGEGDGAEDGTAEGAAEAAVARGGGDPEDVCATHSRAATPARTTAADSAARRPNFFIAVRSNAPVPPSSSVPALEATRLMRGERGSSWQWA